MKSTQRYRKFIIWLTISVNILVAVVLFRCTIKYYLGFDVSGPGQTGYVQANDIDLKLRRLAVDERMLDVVHYGFLPLAAGLMILTASTMWIYRKGPDDE